MEKRKKANRKAKESNPRHKEDFFDLLKHASQPDQEDDQTSSQARTDD